MNRTYLENVFKQNQKKYLDELFELLRIESISNDPNKFNECVKCADSFVQSFKNIGFKAYRFDTSDLPAVFAEYKGDPDLPVILLYGHYDVMPVDPIELWEDDPFEPMIKNGRIYARGAADDKGQVFAFIKALEYLKNNNLLRNTVKVLIDGSEERGSVGLTEKLDSMKSELKADVLMVADTTLTSEGDPAIVMGLRGMVSFEIQMFGPGHDLHSGVHGGVAVNPAEEICKLVGSFYNDDGSVAVNGFYDGVVPATKEELRCAKESNEIDPEKYKKIYNIYPDGGEKGLSQAERIGFRPNLCVNGIVSGYTGEGSKTIIPSEAKCKVSIRLVPGQDPDDILKKVEKHVMANAPETLRTVVANKVANGVGFKLNMHSAYLNKAKKVLTEITERKTRFLWEGASIPIVASLLNVSGAEPLLVGFSTDDDNIHAPNESFPLESLKNGFIYTIRMMAEHK